MTRPKFDYLNTVLKQKWRDRPRTTSAPSQGFRSLRGSTQTSNAEYQKFIVADAAEAGSWQEWLYGENTHMSDGTPSQALVDWIQRNRRILEIEGYAEQHESVRVWNASLGFWSFDDLGKFVFSNEYWEYLISEEYVERWIECRQNQLRIEVEGLSLRFPREVVEGKVNRIGFIDSNEYNPVIGLSFESEIYELQYEANENPLRRSQLSLTIK